MGKMEKETEATMGRCKERHELERERESEFCHEPKAEESCCASAWHLKAYEL